MTNKAEPSGLALLRVPFEPNQISKLPKPYSRDSTKGNCQECGGYHGLPAAHLDYVGHAALTDRLLNVDPEWTWEPVAFDERGLPALDNEGGLWIRLAVCGVTRLGYGDAQGKTGGNAMKERIGDALRNAAMRFGAALDLWHKGELHADNDSDDRPKGNAAKPKSDPPKNNAPMEKALDAAKDPAKEVEEIWGHGAAHAKQDEILNICRELGAAGDASLTGHKKLADYVLERFDEPLSKLSVKSVGILIEELTERLAERKAMSEESSGDGTPTHSGPSPISPQQLTTLEKVCDLKNYKHEDCALEYSEGEVNTLEGLTEQQAAEAIKKVQKMAKIEVAK